MNKQMHKNLHTRDREISHVINEVQNFDLGRVAGQKKGIKAIDQAMQRLGFIDTDLLHLKGGLLEVLGKPQDAVGAYQQILRLIPNHLGAITDLADVYFDLQEFPKALTRYNRALKLITTRTGYRGRFTFDVKGEDFLHATTGKADTLLELERTNESLKCIVDALQLYPFDIGLCSCLERAQEQFHRIKLK